MFRGFEDELQELQEFLQLTKAAAGGFSFSFFFFLKTICTIIIPPLLSSIVIHCSLSHAYKSKHTASLRRVGVGGIQLRCTVGIFAGQIQTVVKMTGGITRERVFFFPPPGVLILPLVHVGSESQQGEAKGSEDN